MVQQSIACRLFILRQLKPKPTPSQSPGDDVFKTHKRTAADEQHVVRVKADPRLHRMLVAALWWHRGDRAFEELQDGVQDTLSQILVASPAP